MFSTQVLNVQVPFLFKNIIDMLNVPITAGTTVWVLAGSLIAGCKIIMFHDLPPISEAWYYYNHPDGLARIGATLSTELLNAVFARVGQSAVRRVARETFEHLLNLDLKFHLSRQTGGLTRAIDRGTKWVA